MTGILEVLVLGLCVYGLYKAVRLYLWWHSNDCPGCGAAPRTPHKAGCRHVPERTRR